MKNKGTIEEAAEIYWKMQYLMALDESTKPYIIQDFTAGAKWQQEKMYSDMQEYAEFCIECDRKEMPLLLVQDWYEHYKNK
jgi:hypothetical protein